MQIHNAHFLLIALTMLSRQTKKTIESEGVKSNWNILVYARCPAGEEWLRLRDTIWPAD